MFHGVKQISLTEFVHAKLDEDSELDEFTNRATQMLYTLAERSGFSSDDVIIDVIDDPMNNGEVGRIQTTLGGLFIMFANNTPPDDVVRLLSQSVTINGVSVVSPVIHTTGEFTNNYGEAVTQLMISLWQSVLVDYGYRATWDPEFEGETLARYATLLPRPMESCWAPQHKTMQVRMEREERTSGFFAKDMVIYNNKPVAKEARRF